jgi:hypothetical protein
LSRAIVIARPVAGRLPLCVQPTNSSGRESGVYVQSAIVVAGAPLVDMDIGASYLAGAVVGEFLPGVVFGSLLAEWLEPHRNLSPSITPSDTSPCASGPDLVTARSSW